MNARPKIYKIKFPFGTLIVDFDIYYRIVTDKIKRPYHRYKRINCFYFSKGLLRCRIASRKNYSLARLLLQPRPNQLVDHINRNPLDNRRCNLRIVTSRQNSLNMIAKNSSGYIGVSLYNKTKRLRYCSAKFRRADGKRLSFSLKDTPQNRLHCAIVRDRFVIQSGDSDYAPLNFPILKNSPHKELLLNTPLKDLLSAFPKLRRKKR